MWVVNTHLSHRMASEEQRRQAAELLQWIEELGSAVSEERIGRLVNLFMFITLRYE